MINGETSNTTSLNTDSEYSIVSDMNAPATLIPEIPESLTIEQYTSRFNSAIWLEQIANTPVILAGLGGIGSYVAYLLSRVHPNKIHLYDNDIVESGNMSGQLYSREYIGQPKALAIQNIMQKFSGYYQTYTWGRYTADSGASNVMICGFDNMEARKTFFENWLGLVNSLPDSRKCYCLYIDGRLAAEQFQVLCIRGDDTYNIERYRKDWLFSDEEAEATVCSYKQTSFMATMIASVMVNLFVNFCANILDNADKPVIDRSMPFITEYDGTMMMFHTED